MVKKMLTRIVIGAGLIGVLAGVAWLGLSVLDGAWATRVLLWVIAALSVHEGLALAGRRVECYPGLTLFAAVSIAAVVIPSIIWRSEVGPEMLLLAGLAGAGVRFLGLAPVRSSATAFPEAAVLFAMIAYVGGGLLFLDRILVHQGVAATFAVVAISKSSDVAGYFVGTLIGRHRIAPAGALPGD